MTPPAGHDVDVSTPQQIHRPDAVLFDIDGTLVDSNYLHVFAWSDAFRAVDRAVPAWRIHRCIGMDSAALLAELLGDDADALGERAKEEHGRQYAELSDRLEVLPGARELLADLAAAGIRVVLATSAPPEELERLRAVLHVEDDVAAITAANDVETAKPAPDVVGVALEKAGVLADRAFFVGDAAWDVQAAARAGVPCVGVRSGGIAPAELIDAGAVAVYDDVAHLRAAVGGPDDAWLRPPEDVDVPHKGAPATT